MNGKYDSYRDSFLHYLTLAGWGNESSGDSATYGARFTRISLDWDDVKPSNTEFASLIQGWAQENDVVPSGSLPSQITGHWLVSEDAHGFVHVRHFPTEAAVKARFEAFAEHYVQWEEE